MQRSQVVVVTGASAGIGRATARAFANEGARVALLARNEERLQSALEEVLAAGGEGVIIPMDVADPEQMEAAAARVEGELGPIDVWVNNAMTTVFSPVSKISPEEFRRVTDVTYHGTVYGTMAALKRMRPRDRGVIVQVGSALGYRSIPLQAAYCGAKHAVVGFTDSLRSELLYEGAGIHLTMVNLGAFNTPQFSWSRSHMPQHPQPLPPIYQPELAAEAIVWASKQRKREVYVGAPAVVSVFWNKFIPGVADKSLALRGIDSQLTDVPVKPGEPDNLFEPAPGDFGARGVFDDQARPDSVQFRLAQRLGIPVVTDTLIALAGGVKEGMDMAQAMLQKVRGSAQQSQHQGPEQEQQERRRQAA